MSMKALSCLCTENWIPDNFVCSVSLWHHVIFFQYILTIAKALQLKISHKVNTLGISCVFLVKKLITLNEHQNLYPAVGTR